MAEKKNSQKLTVEQAMLRMEQIQEIIQKGEISLNKSVELFEEAAKLYAFCNDKLNELEDRVKILSKSTDGKIIEIPFEVDDE